MINTKGFVARHMEIAHDEHIALQNSGTSTMSSVRSVAGNAPDAIGTSQILSVSAKKHAAHSRAGGRRITHATLGNDSVAGTMELAFVVCTRYELHFPTPHPAPRPPLP